MEPSDDAAPTEVQAPPPAPSPTGSPFVFAVVLAGLGAAAAVAASVLPYATSFGSQGRLVDFRTPARTWAWSAVQLWGLAFVILAAAVMLLLGRRAEAVFASMLVAFGIVTLLLYGPILGQVAMADGVDPSTGAYLGTLAGPIVLAAGIVALSTARAPAEETPPVST
jgi:hypothetical protein